MEMTVYAESTSKQWSCRLHIDGDSPRWIPYIGPCVEPEFEAIRKCVTYAKRQIWYGLYRTGGMYVDILPGNVIRGK